MTFPLFKPLCLVCYILYMLNVAQLSLKPSTEPLAKGNIFPLL